MFYGFGDKIVKNVFEKFTILENTKQDHDFQQSSQHKKAVSSDEEEVEKPKKRPKVFALDKQMEASEKKDQENIR